MKPLVTEVFLPIADEIKYGFICVVYVEIRSEGIVQAIDILLVVGDIG
jgi:hypothetical protein